MTITIGRRTFMAALSGAAVAWPVTALAQEHGQVFFGPLAFPRDR
jgi:hypothetical protein